MAAFCPLLAVTTAPLFNPVEISAWCHLPNAPCTPAPLQMEPWLPPGVQMATKEQLKLSVSPPVLGSCSLPETPPPPRSLPVPMFSSHSLEEAEGLPPLGPGLLWGGFWASGRPPGKHLVSTLSSLRLCASLVPLPS